MGTGTGAFGNKDLDWNSGTSNVLAGQGPWQESASKESTVPSFSPFLEVFSPSLLFINIGKNFVLCNGF